MIVSMMNAYICVAGKLDIFMIGWTDNDTKLT